MATNTHPRVVSREEWVLARKKLLVKEKELTRQRDALAEERRELPWVRVERPYTFTSRQGEKSLSDLFGGRRQLLVYHFMFGPEWEEGCPTCSMAADHFDGSIVHLANRDVSFVVASRAPIERLEAFRKRMGWKFEWVSSNGNRFNFDYHVSFTKEEFASGSAYYNYADKGFPADEAPGLTAFIKNDAGEVFHTYSTFGRGPEHVLVPYSYLDLVPKGRDEAGLPRPMAWIRHHDRYGLTP
ncbi:thioredoxin family protein [Pendulispora rubella]|uniref:Thioredoxin family protein n=1 Tax=Pendulispora rubella TaxID=2741070 RepID=A0ABZ2KTV0_9BACT